VAPGETLTKLAGSYGVSMASIRAANRLRDHNIRIGQKLIIPGS
jgi:N-acetylmuramoyl-L-alanine amidase